MFNIRHALSGVPARPGFLIAAVLALGLGTWYLGTTWSRCTGLAEGRARLLAAIDKAGAGGVLDLAAALPGGWDEARIVEGHKLKQGEQPLECPFGWDIDRAERAKLIVAGDYTLIGLFSGGHFQRYIEWRRDWARFAGDVKSVPAAAARFAVSKPDGGPYELTRLPQ